MFVFVLLVGLVASALGQDATSQGTIVQSSSSSTSSSSSSQSTSSSSSSSSSFSSASDCDNGSAPVCGENEVYSSSAIICPPQSCESIYTTYMCEMVEPRPGCNCIDGYLRDKNNRCIPSDQCEIPGGNGGGGDVIGCKGDPNASLSDCPSPCPATCDKPNPQACIAMCEAPGCVCNPGYLLSEGKCVKPTNCPGAVQPEQCGYNEVYTEAKRTCPPQVCEALYLNYLCSADDQPKPGCVCIDGHLRNSSGVCIPVLECPRDGAPVVVDLCGPNASRTDCTSNCPPTCERQNPICILSCGPPGCQCNPGYVRDSQGNCILPENCPVNKPKVCLDDNAEYRSCASACTPTCENPNPNCILSCQPGRCQCKNGYVLSGGKCILRENCPKVCEDPNAEYKECGSACIPTCGNPEPICAAACLSGRCQCKNGFVLLNGKCILRKRCPSNI